jgi:Cu-Zn family superoxide dismutase
MKTGLLLIIIISTMLMAATTIYAHEDATHGTIATLKDAKGNTVGLANFIEEASDLIRINVNANGLTPDLHGIHMHNKGNCTGPLFISAGDHYNPLSKEHDLNNPRGPHAGDLPNLEVGEDGKGHMNITTTFVTVSSGPTTLFTANGTSLVIHANPDDEMTNPTGNSGLRVTCGVIKKK